jgi:exopolysaccharide biosynthesis protein
MTSSVRPRVAAAGAVLLAAIAGLCIAPAGASAAGSLTLPLGDQNLTETRSSQTLTDGVSLTSIVRGTEPAPADQINTTTRGPWSIKVLTVDPDEAKGHVKATYGPDLARTEKTTDLVRGAGALAGVNASFFTFTASQQYPGDPVGLGIFDGKLLSEPLTDPAETNFVVDAKTSKALIGHLSWTGSLENKKTEAVLPLEFVNHPPVVPAACTTLADQTDCTAAGDVVLFTPEFAASTPAGAGIVVVLDKRGCVVRTATTRGTALTAGQTSVQATGHDTVALFQTLAGGCVSTTLAVRDEAGKKVALRNSLYGVTGRGLLVRDGKIVEQPTGGSFNDRNPRTIAGTTKDGKLVFVTVDGRQTTSVGTTMAESAALAKALGLQNAMNLDGGGSTAMAVNGALVNHPAGAERAVGDALVYVDAKYQR